MEREREREREGETERDRETDRHRERLCLSSGVVSIIHWADDQCPVSTERRSMGNPQDKSGFQSEHVMDVSIKTPRMSGLGEGRTGLLDWVCCHGAYHHGAGHRDTANLDRGKLGTALDISVTSAQSSIQELTIHMILDCVTHCLYYPG